MAAAPADRSHWSVDRRVPLATLIALIVQTGGMVWWASSIQSTVSQHESTLQEFRSNGTPGTREKLSRLEARTDGLAQRLDRIEQGIDRLDRKLDAALDRERK